MKNLFPLYFIIFLGVIIPVTAICQCSNFYTHTYDYFAVYPYTINVDITNNGGATNLRIRTFRDGNGNKVIMDNPDALSTIKYGGLNEDFNSLNTCGLTVSNAPYWTNYGLLAENSIPNIHIGTSYIPVTLRINGVYKYGWVKIGITPTADSVFLYSVMIDQTSSSSSFKIGQCDVTWPSVCTTNILETNNSVNALTVYPNPATNLLMISTTAELKKATIYTLEGKKILEVLQPGEQLDISVLSDGVYFIELTSETNSITRRFVKH